jgi:hypothetical protein
MKKLVIIFLSFLTILFSSQRYIYAQISEPSPIPEQTASPAPTASPEGDEIALPTVAASDEPQAVEVESLAEETESGNVGDTEVTTENALVSASSTTVGNTNLSNGNTAALDEGDEISQVAFDNDSSLENSSSLEITNEDETTQENSAVLVNDLTAEVATGTNSASNNIGNLSIESGDAKVSGTLVSVVNTNIDGITISETDISETYIGDILLMPAESPLPSLSHSIIVANEGQGSASSSEVQASVENVESISQNNDVVIVNTLALLADSGNNKASDNTGDSEITTGDAMVGATLLTFANNNLYGDIYFYGVDIYGTLTGDIILPDGFFESGGELLVVGNDDNGSDSSNQTSLETESTKEISQNNVANIENNLLLSAETGGNTINNQTDGDASITSGQGKVEANVINIVNTNLASGNMWFVIVNTAGEWIGKILGTAEGKSWAAGGQTEVEVDPVTGEIRVENTASGRDTENSASVRSDNEIGLSQTNTADITNNLSLSVSTGRNEISQTAQGESRIMTGNATIIANMVNFVNNNIVGGSKLVVAIVNVFGSWFGNFVTPGSSDPSEPANPTPPPASDNAGGIGGSNSDSGTSEPSSSNTPEGQNLAVTVIRATSQVAGLTIENQEGSLSESLGANPQNQIVGNKNTLNLAWLIALVPLALLFALVLKLRRNLVRNN